ncbi:hypothetical protein nbrc107697_29010 [Gordonia crocea]|uniref:MFS transporter n=1 Tax=Gordonia crocea TaxID=589162 RepID=A0A7I9V112_9ACTN|nr:hypothetical protein nbrc107697_29010 [Gordonia crocea]
MAVLQFGIPVGTILAFFTTGLITDAFDSWRAPFLVAAVRVSSWLCSCCVSTNPRAVPPTTCP